MRVDPWPFIIAAYAIAILGTLALTLWSWRAMHKAERDAEAVSKSREADA
jgi:glycerol uptake facilitator-like aquaporin